MKETNSFQSTDSLIMGSNLQTSIKSTPSTSLMTPAFIQNPESPQMREPFSLPSVKIKQRRASIKQSLASSISSHKSLNTSLHASSPDNQQTQPSPTGPKISKFKLFSKFTFSKQNPHQNTGNTPKTSILSKSIKAEEQKQKIANPSSLSNITSTSTFEPVLEHATSSNNIKESAEHAITLTPSGSETSATSVANTSHGREITLSIKEEDEEAEALKEEQMNHIDAYTHIDTTTTTTTTTTTAATNTNTYTQSSSISEGFNLLTKNPVNSRLKYPSQQELLLQIQPTMDTSSEYQTAQSPNLFGSAHNVHRSLLLDSDSDSEEELDPKKLKSEENIEDYRPGGYHPVFTGETYGKENEYLIVRKLGWGHFSTVWFAWDEKHARHVAIKIVRSSRNYTEAALDEIKILEKVASSNDAHEGKQHIVQLLDHFIHKGPNGSHVCMVFEVLGENMLNLLLRYREFQANRQKEIGDLLEKDDKDERNWAVHINNLNDLHILSESYGGLPLTLVKQISKQILLGLDYLHRECGIIHTDIKPENILVEIHDVEKLVELLEFERRSKKLQKLMLRREKDHSQSLAIHPSYSFTIAQNSRVNSLSTSSSTSMTPQTPHQYHSLSRSISTHHSFIPHTPNPTHSMHASNSNNNLNGNLSRKNSIPVRPSKPLTSPVETSSVNNFFRSFSFSQNRTPSFSTNVINHLTPPVSVSANNTSSPLMNKPFPVEKRSSDFDSSYSLGVAIINEAELGEKISKHATDNSSRQRPLLSDVKSSSTLVAVPVKQSQTQLSSSSENEDDVFFDANQLPTLNDMQSSLKSASITSLNSLKTIPSNSNGNDQTVSNHPRDGEAVPFPVPFIEESKEFQKPVLKVDTSAVSDDNISALQVSVLSEFEEIISIKIADLGNSCWYNKHYTSDIQTRQYRAPEVILGGEWGCSTDLWSTACLIFELITSDYLFDAKGAGSYTRDDDHLAQIVELLQCWPQKEYLRTCKRWRDFFDRSGQNFKRIGKLKIWPLKMVLIDEYKMKEDLAETISSFLLPMLEFDPKNRVDAGSMCAHPWIKDITGGSNLEREFCLHGEDIKGYYEEWQQIV